MQLYVGSDAVTTDNTGLTFTLTGTYSDGRYEHRFRKRDEGGGIPLYIDRTESTANSHTAIARFGSYTSNPDQFEVYGGMRAASGAIIGKLAVKSSAVHGSYDFYNNGTSYFNGSVIIDDALDITGTNRALKIAGTTRINSVGDFIGTSYYVGGTNVINTSGNWVGPAINAGTLDSLDSTQFLRSDAADTATGKITFNAGIDGQAIFLSGAQNFDALKQIGFYSLYNANASGHTNAPFQYGAMISSNSNAAGGMGMQFAHERTGTGTYIRGMNDTGDTWYPWQEVWTSGTDGSGSGLDADTVDGIQGASFLRSDASDSIAAGTTYTFGTSDTEGLRFTNSA
ncbi:MAG: hypothetical protein CBD16_10160, partial [Betaproteobacteria bacterium TMED156]